MKKFALLSFIIFAISCSNDNSTPCNYEGVELDIDNAGELNDNDIIAEWELQSFVDLTDCSMKNPEPEGYYIELEFKESNQIKGHTSNEFYGTYILEDNKIEISISTITLINDLEWGRKFLNAASNTDFIFIEDSKLFIFFNQSSEIMVFTRI